MCPKMDFPCFWRFIDCGMPLQVPTRYVRVRGRSGISSETLRVAYWAYKDRITPKILQDPDPQLGSAIIIGQHKAKWAEILILVQFEVRAQLLYRHSGARMDPIFDSYAPKGYFKRLIVWIFDILFQLEMVITLPNRSPIKISLLLRFS